MKRPVHSSIATAILAGVAAIASFAPAAHADTAVVVQTPGYRSYAEVLGGPPLYAYDSREFDATHHRRHCRAPVWDPNVRYMPGDTVVRKGELYVARGISARVYNENSPPEWTPNYWAQARC